MTQPRSLYIPIGGHEIHVTEWGDPAAPAVVMWHGLARVGRDFDPIAARLADRYRILCPDTIGRGLSSWSDKPEQEYVLEHYVTQVAPLLDALGVGTCAWVGTSMGGLVGLLSAAGPLKERISRLVLNDIGPVLANAAVARIATYATAFPDFPNMAAFEWSMRIIYAPFGAQTDAEWRRMAETSVRRRDDGRLVAHYDPRVMTVFAAAVPTLNDLWEDYDRLACPVLVLRGETSDLLEPHVAEEMTRRGPKARLATIPGCGHAPALNTEEQIGLVAEFLAGK